MLTKESKAGKREDRYTKLTQDLKAAVEAAQAAAAAIDDGGTCNMDSPMVWLPRWNAAKIKEAARAAGSGAYKHRGSWWIFRTGVYAQGDPRTIAAKAASSLMEARGYKATVYYMMD